METAQRQVERLGPHGRHEVDDTLAVEAPLEIRLGGVPLAVLMRTPGADRDLVLGFCLTEGILLSPSEAAEVRPWGEGDRYEVVLAEGVEVDPNQFRRNAYTTSSCGVCGKASIDAVRVTAAPLPPGPTLSSGLLAALPEKLAAAQPGFAATGAVHGAALIEPGGALLGAAEDVGRHNAVDKVVGSLAPSRWPLGEAVLMVSGRVSFEITQKAAVAGVPVVAGVSAASSLAVELAEELGITLLGFVRQGTATVYADPGGRLR